jgi:ATP adenylyltransferase
MTVKDVGCRWCDDFHRPVADRPPWNHPVLAGQGFEVVPSLGALVPGWLLVAPVEHRLRVANCSPEERQALTVVRRRVQDELGATFGPVVAFEHGPRTPGSAAGCSVDHAHLHVVPVNGPVFETARGLAPELSWERVPSMDAAWDSVEAADAYVVFEREGVTWLARDRADDIPSQLFRRAIARVTSHSEWNWRAEPQAGNVKLTMRVLASARR